MWAAATLSERVTSVCGRISVVSLTSDLKQLLRSVMYSVPGYGSCHSSLQAQGLVLWKCSQFCLPNGSHKQASMHSMLEGPMCVVTRHLS